MTKGVVGGAGPLTEAEGRSARPALVTASIAVLPCAIVLLCFLVPGNFVIPGPLKSNGAPARLLSLVCLGLALLTVVSAARRRVHPGTPRWTLVGGALFLYLAAQLWSYGVAYTSALDSAQSAGVLRSLVGSFAIAGVGVYLWLNLTRWAEVSRILAFVVVGATLSAVVAALNYAGVLPNWTTFMPGTGLVENTSTLRDLSRLDFLRARGTSEHPIEYSLGLTAALPIALHLARFAARRAVRIACGLATLVIVAAIPLSVSRTAILGLVIALVIAVSALPALARLASVAIAVAGVVLFFVMVPTLATSLTEIFSLAEEDNSVQGRLSDYSVVARLFSAHPWVGLGAGVYRPDTGGNFLDNTWLGTLIAGGALGVVVLAILFLVAFGTAWDRSLTAATPERRSLHRSLLAVLAVVLMGSVTSDVTSFQQPMVLLMVTLGMLASRALRDPDQLEPATPATSAETAVDASRPTHAR